MSINTIQLLLVSSATAHLVVSAIMGLYARHKVQYLCLAWVNGIFGFVLAAVTTISEQIAEGEPGIMHPAMIMPLLCGVYLQSIFPLSIPMPGFLQAKRMVKYARPVLALITVILLSCTPSRRSSRTFFPAMSCYVFWHWVSAFTILSTSSCCLVEWFIRPISPAT